MATVRYTNRKGLTYYLCRGTTRTGQARYVFAREPQGEPMEELPPGYRVRESVNGIVSLVKDVPATIRPEEVGVVDAAVRQHPRAHRYRVAVRRAAVEVCEQDGPDADDLTDLLGRAGLGHGRAREVVRAELEQHAHYSPILRFRLTDSARRTFAADRRSYLRGGEWLALAAGPLEELARRLIPTLGTDQFFELH